MSAPKPPIPRDLNEAVDILLSQMTPQEQADYTAQPGGKPGTQVGFGFLSGMAIRNAWGLWFGKTPVSKWLRVNGLYHGDDQSSVIFHALWHRLRNLPFDLPAEAEWYRVFWKDQGIDHAKDCPAA